MYRSPAKHIATIMENIIVWMGTTKSFSVIFLFTAAFLLLLSNPNVWSGNEENYFQLSLKRLSPESFTDAHAAFDNSQVKIASELLIGATIDVLGYDDAHRFLRIVIALAFGFSLTFLFKTIGLTALESAVVLSAFYLADQNLVGGEWIFPGVEGKSFAYILVICAIGFTLQKKAPQAIFVFAAATYFHILVGGF